MDRVLPLFPIGLLANVYLRLIGTSEFLGPLHVFISMNHEFHSAKYWDSYKRRGMFHKPYFGEKTKSDQMCEYLTLRKMN